MTQKTRNKIVIYLKRLIRIFDEYTKDKKEENIYSQRFKKCQKLLKKNYLPNSQTNFLTNKKSQKLAEMTCLTQPQIDDGYRGTHPH